MSLTQHFVVIVTADDRTAIEAAYAKALEIFTRTPSMVRIISPILLSVSNSYYSFAVLPDGSGEGYGASDRGDERREELKAWLRNGWKSNMFYRWVEVAYGGEGPEWINDSDTKDADECPTTSPRRSTRKTYSAMDRMY